MKEETTKVKSIEELNAIADRVVEAIFSVHRTLGPGCAESIYESCLIEEFEQRGIKYESQVKIQVTYKGKALQKYFRLDLVAEDEIIIELKSVSEILPLHKAQLLSYMKLAKKRLGYLANFNTPLMKHGIKRMRLDAGSQYINIYSDDEN